MSQSVVAGRALVIEDEALVAMSMCDDLTELGWRVVGPYGNLADAVQAAMCETFDIALVDLNLHNQMSYPLLDRLVALNVPAALVTAYAEEGVPDRFKRTHPRKAAGTTSAVHTSAV